MPVIADGISHFFYRGEPGEITALKDIRITIGEGESVLVAGPNGSGKSTLLQCLSGLLRPARGRVTIDGIDAVKARGVATLAVQSPERALFAPTVYDDIAFGPRNLGIRKEDIHIRVIEAAGAVGLGEAMLMRHPRTLSHGQRRLAALAGVIAVKPRYLFLDEPTAGLDAKGKERVANLLKKMNGDGTAIIVASHDLSRMMGSCERIVVLDSGGIYMDGRPDDLVSQEGIEEIGLTLPPSVKAARWLRGHGIDEPWNISPEALAGHLRCMP